MTVENLATNKMQRSRRNLQEVIGQGLDVRAVAFGGPQPRLERLNTPIAENWMLRVGKNDNPTIRPSQGSY